MVYGFVPHCKQVRRKRRSLAVKHIRFASVPVFVVSCTIQASIRAFIGSKEIKTMVSTSELAVTKGKVRETLVAMCSLFQLSHPESRKTLTFQRCVLFQTLHQLTARAIIRDWTEGSLDFDRTEHEVILSWPSAGLTCFSFFYPQSC